MQIHLILGIVSAVLLTLSGCNTLRSVGKDVESVGHGIERVAR